MLPAMLLYPVFFLLQTSIKSNGGKGKMDPAIWMWAINLLYFCAGGAVKPVGHGADAPLPRPF